MKRKITIASLLLSGSIVMLFAAAKTETCADAFKKCSASCDAELSKCKLSGRSDETCEQAFKICTTKCSNAKVTCENGKK